MSRLGANGLGYESDLGPLTVPSQYNRVNRLAPGEYYDAALQAVMAEMALVSGEALMEAQTEGTHEYAAVAYPVTLEHTPKQGLPNHRQIRAGTATRCGRNTGRYLG